jgi:hypothetical protein
LFPSAESLETIERDQREIIENATAPEHLDDIEIIVPALEELFRKKEQELVKRELGIEDETEEAEEEDLREKFKLLAKD